MKKINYLLAILLITFATSCSKDDDKTVQNQDILGVWNMTGVHCNDGVTTTESAGGEISSEYTFYGTDINATATFSENPNEFLSQGTYTEVLTTYINGVEFSSDEYILPYSTIGTWSINGNVLAISSNMGTLDAEIIELSSTVLKFKHELYNQETLNGMTITQSATTYYEFSKN